MIINGGLRKIILALVLMTGINLSTAQTVIEGKLLVLTLNDEA